MTKRRTLQKSSPLLSVLEPGGGFQPSRVVSRRTIDNTQNLTDEDANPEDVISSASPYIGTDVAVSKDMLDSISATDEVADVMSRMISYIAVVPDIGSGFAYTGLVDKHSLSDELASKLSEDMQSAWLSLNKMLLQIDGSLAIGIHDFVAQWLTYGIMYVMIVRESHTSNRIIDIHAQIDPPTTQLTNTGEKIYVTDFGQTVWSQDDVFVLDYKRIDRNTVSYVSSIMRSYNTFRAIERTRVANAIMAAQFRSVYTVPTAGLGPVKAKQRLSKIMGLYKRDVQIDDQSGEVIINGKNSYPVNTEIWVSETSAGAVKIDNPGDGNPQLNSMDMPEYFMRKFYKRAKLPMSKYEAVDSGYLSGLSDIDEDERQFKLYISKCRAVLSKLFCDILFRMLENNSVYTGRGDVRDAMTLFWHSDQKVETPTDVLDQIEERLGKVADLIDAHAKLLESAGFSDDQVKARSNAMRIKLLRRFVPEILEQTDELWLEQQDDKAESDDSSSSSFSYDEDGFDSNEDEGGGGSDPFSGFDDDDFGSMFDDSNDWPDF